MFTTFLHWLIPVAKAVVLENAGSWTSTGMPNPGIQSMWIRICNTLPFCGVGPAAPAFFVTKVINFVLYCISGIAVAMIVYGAIKMVISQGNEEALGETRKIVTYALVGLILALLARAIMAYIANVVLNQILS